jgi:hypothetical protein
MKEAPSEIQDHGGLTPAGQYLCASCITFLGIYLVMTLSYFGRNTLPFDFGGCLIMAPIALVSLFCSTIGLLAKPKGKEWIFLIPSLGPILPLVIAIACVYIFATGAGE